MVQPDDAFPCRGGNIPDIRVFSRSSSTHSALPACCAFMSIWWHVKRLRARRVAEASSASISAAEVRLDPEKIQTRFHNWERALVRTLNDDAGCAGRGYAVCHCFKQRRGAG